MKKKLGVYSAVAEAIRDFSEHRINRQEFYEIICNCLLEVTNEDKEQVLNPKEYGGITDYQFGKNWLNKK